MGFQCVSSVFIRPRFCYNDLRMIPSTSTTLLRQIGGDVHHARWAFRVNGGKKEGDDADEGDAVFVAPGA